uniref:CSON013828 protein n=1 Tax=Culicoides sonorensis TaxID=179676 RepID=A0A336LNM7_CULSO
MDKPGTPTSQQFCLRWHNHTTSLLSSLPGLLDQSHLTDVTLSAEGRTIKAHKIILSACSTFFAELFKNLDATPHQHPVIILPGTSFPSIVALMQFMYAGEVNVFEEQISNLLSLAETLGIKGLADFNNGKSPHKSETSLSSPQPEKDPDSPPMTPKQQSPLESFFSRSLNLFPHMMPEPLNYSNSRSSEIFNRLTQSASQLKHPSSPNSCKSNSISIDENANIENRDKSPFSERRASSVGPVSHLSNSKQASSDIKRIDKIAETLRSVNKNYFEQLSNQNNKSCTLIPHSPPVSVSQMKQQQQPGFPPNFPGHFMSDDVGIRRTPENMMFEPQMTMSENYTGNSDIMMDKPALPKPANQKLYATCFICNKKLSNQYNLRVHLETHQNMRYACQVCNHVSRSKDALRKHVSYRHPGTSTCDPDAKRKRNRMNILPIPLSPTAQATMMLQHQANNMQMPTGMFMPPQMMNMPDQTQFIKRETSLHEIPPNSNVTTVTNNTTSVSDHVKSEGDKTSVTTTTTTTANTENHAMEST